MCCNLATRCSSSSHLKSYYVIETFCDLVCLNSEILHSINEIAGRRERICVCVCGCVYIRIENKNSEVESDVTGVVTPMAESSGGVEK